VINVRAEIDEVQKALEGTAKSIASIEKKSLTEISKDVVKKENEAFNAADFYHGKALLAHKYEYNLKSIFKKGKVKNGEVNIFPKRYEQGRGNDIIIPVLVSLNYGRTYKVRKSSHTIKGRHFIEQAENYLEGNSFEQTLQKIVDTEMNKYWG